MATRTVYYRHSPRGFANEIDIYAVPHDIAPSWLANRERDPKSDYAETAYYQISRREAARLIASGDARLMLPSNVCRDYGEPILSAHLVAAARSLLTSEWTQTAGERIDAMETV